MAHTLIEIGVAAVRNSQGHILMAERTARQISAGFWELPGGKIEPGETPAQAAIREAYEETGITASTVRPMMTYDHAFPSKRVRLHIFDVAAWSGTPSGREGQRIAWVDPARPAVAPILPSNSRVLAALSLPPEIYIADLAQPGGSLAAEIDAALASGVRLIQLRAERLVPGQRVAAARRIATRLEACGARFLLAGSALDAGRAGAAGMHSEAAALRCMPARPPVPLWSVFCCNADDLARAAALGADLAIIDQQAHAAPRAKNARRLAGFGQLPIYQLH